MFSPQITVPLSPPPQCLQATTQQTLLGRNWMCMYYCTSLYIVHIISFCMLKLVRYQHMSQREKRDFNFNDVNNSHGNWKHPSAPGAESKSLPGPLAMPVPAKPTGSLLALWGAKEKSKASSSHMEFAGRSYGGAKAELYPQMR